MWGVDRARDVTQSPKLWTLFGTQGPVEPGKVYGDIAQGTARVLYTPAITHPAEHISHEAIGYSLDWFAKTLKGGTPLPADDQIWFRKEIGTLIALLGFVALLIGAFDAPAGSANVFPPAAARDRRRHHAGAFRGERPPLDHGLHPVRLHPGADLLSRLRAGRHFRKAVGLPPQGITNQIMVWAVINALITLALMRFAPKRASRAGIIGHRSLSRSPPSRSAMRRCGWPISPSRSTSGSGSWR